METTINSFSKLAFVMRDFEKENEFKTLNSRKSPYRPEQLTPDAIAKRYDKACSDFDFFDRTYFRKDMYSDGYSRPSGFHKELFYWANQPGVNVILGPRKFGKTATQKKIFAWMLLTGKYTFLATLSSTLPTSRNILADIAELLDNDRIMIDFSPEIVESNKDQFTIRLPKVNKISRAISLSEGRSARGATKIFTRPQFILCDDLETRQSGLSEEQTLQRIKILQETYQSMSQTGTLLVLGNNFDERCALNRLLIQKNEGLLPDYWNIATFKAWTDEQGSLWQERYPAKTEEDLKAMLKVSDLHEWLADFQQEPAKPDGFIFERLTPTPIWDEIPADARGVLYADPNCSLKGKGDTTAIVALLYSSATNYYYVANLICQSYSDADKLLTDYLEMKDHRVRYCGFDGHVAQESTWTNNVRSWCRLRNLPFPTIFYRRYNVDELSKNIQMAWRSGRILLPPSINSSQDGQAALKQLYSFRGKAAKKRDDFPDGLISAFELLHEFHLGNRVSSNIVSKITDFFNF
jgi:hypothetical protein